MKFELPNSSVIDLPFFTGNQKGETKTKMTEYETPIEARRIYTFYALELMHSHMSNTESVKWCNQSDIDALEMELHLFTEKLRDHLLEIVGYSVCCEVRHTYVESSYASNKHLFTKSEQNIINYIHGLNRGGSYESLCRTIPQPKDRIQFCLKAFNLKWEPAYGGEKWAEGCRAWLKLYEAKTLPDMVFWIDRVYDLQHNSGVLFNKHQDYEHKDGFIHKALTQKRYAKNVYDVIFKRKYANKYAIGLLPMTLPKYHKIITKYLRSFPLKDTRNVYELESTKLEDYWWYTMPNKVTINKTKYPKILKNEYNKRKQRESTCY